MTFNFKKFANPPTEFRPMPLWTWNGKMSKERITETLEQYATQGFGGSFIHPRPGLVIEYLSDEWFELWGFALEESKRLGMQCNIYDEDTYPSGFAGGHVADRLPDATATYAIGRIIDPGDQTPEAEETLAIAELPHSNSKLFVTSRKATPTPWTAWHPPVDMLDPRVAETFIETTHEAYAKHVGDELGKGIQYAFADEPTWMMRDDDCKTERAIPISDLLFEEFQTEHEYDLRERIADLFIPGNETAVTRYDYFSTLHRVWTTNFLRPLYEWCETHQTNFTGHFMEHEWPLPINQGSTMDAYRWMQTPGIDLLGFQYNFENPTKNDFLLLTVKEVSSAARQLGRPRVLSETHGGGGHAATFDRFKELTDWEMVHGINLVNPHMSVETIAGARKYDWPQTYSDHSPWWKHYRLHADHTARVAAALTEGQLANRTLVLHPTTSGWLHYTPEEKDGTFNQPLAALRDRQSHLVQFLADTQIDFDLGDELLMRDLACVENGKLRVGEAVYEQIVLPENMETWCESTLALIEAYLETGGILLALDQPPTRVNGRLDPRPAALQERFSKVWKKADSHDALYELITESCPPRITLDNGNPLPANVHHQYRKLGNGETLHFITHCGDDELSLNVRLPGRSLRTLDTLTGAEKSQVVEESNGTLTATLDLPPSGHALWISSPEPSSATQRTEEKSFQPLETFDRIECTEPNILMLDYCSLTFRGKTQDDIHVMEADTHIWKALGFPRNIWNQSIQFRDEYGQHTFDDTTGFRIDYRFTANAPQEVLNNIELAIERPHLYQISINGKSLDFSDGTRWLDEEIRKAPTSGLLKPGENTITLQRDSFDVFCEIDRIYLLGDFSLAPAKKGFTLEAPLPLALGDWAAQGRPFYTGSARYETEIEIPADAEKLTLKASSWDGAVIRVLLDGEEAGLIGFAPYELMLPAPATGTHRLGIEVVGDLRNLLGGHFSNAVPSRWHWEDHPATQPTGATYRFIPQGLSDSILYRTN